jgi:hypothetical protein
MRGRVTVLLAIIVCASLLSAAMNMNVVTINAPEVFGVQKAYYLPLTHTRETALIFVDWNDKTMIFWMYGKIENKYSRGFIQQIYGERIEQYPPYLCSTQERWCYVRQNKPRSRGWIEFRGHNRPFCLTFTDELPQTCMLR